MLFSRKLAIVALVTAVFGLATAAFSAGLTPPAVNGPWLGDSNVNLFALGNAIIKGQTFGNQTFSTISTTNAQASCTQTGGNMMNYLSASLSGTGYICLPTAVSGRLLMYFNNTTQTVNVFSAVASFTSGTADNINGSAGTSAYTGLTNGKSMICFSPANGQWACGSIS